MKYLVCESQLKNLLKTKFNLDLTDKIRMVTNKWELPFEFDWMISERQLNQYLNAYGPMFVIEGKDNQFLCQNMNNGWQILDTNDYKYSEFQLMRKLGIEVLGLSLSDLIERYFTEDN
jgi:hypothetical protein